MCYICFFNKPWVTKKFVSIIKKRQRAFKAGDLITYRKYRNYINRMSKYLKKNYYGRMRAHIADANSTNWWTVTKELLDLEDNRSDFEALVNDQYDGCITTFVNKANNFFVSLSSNCTPIVANSLAEHELVNYCDRFIITPRSVLSKLLKISINKACGPDGIPNWILKESALAIYLPVAAIFNASLREGYVPPENR